MMKQRLRHLLLLMLPCLAVSCTAPSATHPVRPQDRVGAPFIGMAGVTRLHGDKLDTLLVASVINNASESPEKTMRDVRFRRMIRSAVES